jgi:pantetheine-phosphate adenylyltransferase
MKRKALFAGSFDPYTIGHDAIVQRGLSLFDEIVIAIGVNSEKKTLFSLDERINTIQKIYAYEKKISVSSYDTLTIDFALLSGVNFMLRGIRNFTDFEYEMNMASMNKKLSGIETVFLFSEPEHSFISSTLVRDLILHKKDISTLIPIIK